MFDNNSNTIFFKELTHKQFEDLYVEHYKWLLYAAYSILKDWNLSEDIVQNFFIKCWNDRETLNKINNFKAYSLTAVKNLALNEIKKNQIKIKAEQQLIQKTENDFDEIQDVSEEESQLLKLINLIESLPAKRKQIFISFYFKKNKVEDIAAKENISIETVRTHIKLAYRTLRKMLLFFTGVFV